MNNHHQKWAPHEDLRLLEELKNNISIPQIAINHKRSSTAILARQKLLCPEDKHEKMIMMLAQILAELRILTHKTYPYHE